MAERHDLASGYRCDDCGAEFSTAPYYTGENDVEAFALCVDCAGPYLCPDEPADATSEHASLCVGQCRRTA